MNPSETILAARDRGIRLSVTKDARLVAKPASQLTPELKEAIRANRVALLYDVLLVGALRYLNERYVEGADLSALAAHEDAINDAYLGDWERYRSVVREYVLAGRDEFDRVRQGAA